MERMFLKGFAGRNRPCHMVDEKHSLGKPYMSEHGRHVLRTLEHTGKINKEPSAERRSRSKGGMSMGERPPWHGASSLARKKCRVVSIVLRLVRLPLERREHHAIHADVLLR
jgi:hypothetical protein